MIKAYLSSRLFLWLGVGTAIFFALILSFVKYNSPAKFPGCTPKNPRNFFDPSQTAAVWQNQNINPLLGLKNKLTLDRQKILGIQSQNKIIDISLSQKALTARQGENIILETPVNIGKYVYTPSGEFSVSTKYLSVDLTGGSTLNRTYYYLPNVPYTLYFQPNFALIGSYWSSDFGQVSGFGCIELPLDAAETLFYWADAPLSSSSPGTKIIIHP